MKAVKFLPVVMVVALAACGEKNAPKDETLPAAPASATSAPAASAPAAAPAAPAESAPAAAPASAPAASAASAAAAPAGGGDLALGEKIFTANCASCHGTGVLGAPKFGDKGLWAPRIAQGKETLYTHALNGFKMMPPKGGNAALKDDEVKAAIDYMVSKAS